MNTALTQLVTAETQSYMIRTSWLKAESSAPANAAKPKTEVALQCGSDTGTTSATTSASTFSMGAARALPASFAPVAPVAPEACDPADTTPGHKSACTPPAVENKRSP